MTAATPKCVDVVIVSYRSERTLAEALAPMLDSSLVCSIVVVDHSPDDLSSMVAEGLGVEVRRDPANPGFAAGANLGAKFGHAPYVLLLNPDARLETEDLGGLVNVLKGDKRLAAASPLLRGPSGAVTVPARRLHGPGAAILAAAPVTHRSVSTRLSYDLASATRARVTAVDCLWGACILLRRSALVAIRGFDERFFMYSEDEDLALALKRIGYREVLVSDSIACHVGGASSADAPWLAQARLHFAKAQFYAKWLGSAYGALYVVGALSVMMALIARALLRGERDQLYLNARVMLSFVGMVVRGSARPTVEQAEACRRKRNA